MFAFLQAVFGMLVWLAFARAAGWVFYRLWQRSEDRPKLAVRWLISLADLAFVVFVVGPLFREFGYTAAFAGVPMAAFSGLVMALVWVPDIADNVARKVSQLYDGGDAPPDPEPFFSIAEARRKQGKYAEAEAEVRKQLELFPTNFRGQMLLAEIQANDLHDLSAAAATIDQFVSQPGHAPKNIAFALLRLADWHIKFANDREASRAALERIVQLLPDTPESHIANQRLAHLTPAEMLEQAKARPKLEMPQPIERLGLLGEPPRIKKLDRDPHVVAVELVAQLDRFPADNRTREELALLYLEGFQRPDLAAEQFEQLIAQPNAPAGEIVKWLNMLADVHLNGAGDFAAAQATLQRIVARDPEAPAAAAARRRLALLNREVQAKRQSQVVKLGSYEQRLGLKDRPPRHSA